MKILSLFLAWSIGTSILILNNVSKEVGQSTYQPMDSQYVHPKAVEIIQDVDSHPAPRLSRPGTSISSTLPRQSHYEAVVYGPKSEPSSSPQITESSVPDIMTPQPVNQGVNLVQGLSQVVSQVQTIQTQLQDATRSMQSKTLSFTPTEPILSVQLSISPESLATNVQSFFQDQGLSGLSGLGEVVLTNE